MIRAAALCIALLPAGAAAEGLGDTASEHAALGEELRELFRAEPELVAPAVGPSPALVNTIARTMYSEEIASDLARIEGETASLFGEERPMIGADGKPPAIALFVGPACEECAAAQEELHRLASRLGVAATVIDIGDAEDAAMMARLTLDQVPSYAMRDKLIRGHIPPVVLERYLSE
ncbi:hypothetical protein [Roseivivax sediminis]|uniref:Thioredoxin domain-containing protein n=1 Tax=Roseivivax sediminis TaxID=936889 RepID=A0A1I1WY61_9RHOB|nr:hypothetical protein [Roseivivax sediminis]SFE00115.1 hypothetical protein SAMN04515678_105156 [Roseivivax sediminis]